MNRELEEMVYKDPETHGKRFISSMESKGSEKKQEADFQ